MTAIVAFDHGSRRIGVAIGDTETGMAFARPAFQRRNEADDLAAIADFCRVEGARLVILGLPRNMNGSEGPQAAAARSFGAGLVRIGLEVVYEDERLTSWDAGERLAEAGRRPRRGTGELDSTAARLILQQYLDARRLPDNGEETE